MKGIIFDMKHGFVLKGVFWWNGRATRLVYVATYSPGYAD